MIQRSSLLELKNSLHSVRLATYMDACHNDTVKALELYRWNLQLASAFQEVLSITEIVMRNAIDGALRTWNAHPDQQRRVIPHASQPPRANVLPPGPADWILGAASPLNSLMRSPRDTALRQAREARSRRPASHPRKAAPITHDDLLAQFTFGVFTKLLPTTDTTHRNYANRKLLWEQAVHHAFPHYTDDLDGEILADRVGRLHSLRNRVSHMEPLLSVNAVARHTDALKVIATVSSPTRDWCAGTSRVRTILRAYPL
ncbi:MULTISPECIES: hypothetical protein [Kocuria]|uniref:Abi-like protein n=1 Tax=Kocuria flava TaxID=446860 RepID=A0ABQ0X960_9MICC|nr:MULTISPECIES: hypothetical protein [Kocuria]KLU09007.1 hypothetical protein ABL57_14540 [Kocuria sp. SM24M-10]MEB2529060.1 hypothetical protein [Kocuria rosea]MEB2619265.1 hypothetical protein [Kocuria rosea]GEO93654.1 hypothetical protein KFL01_29600 [Kocuria flava]